jgi:hypothetical protein
MGQSSTDAFGLVNGRWSSEVGGIVHEDRDESRHWMLQSGWNLRKSKDENARGSVTLLTRMIGTLSRKPAVPENKAMHHLACESSGGSVHRHSAKGIIGKDHTNNNPLNDTIP